MADPMPNSLPKSPVAAATDSAGISSLSAVRLCAALRSGEISARETTAHFLDRITASNTTLGAFVSVSAEHALTAAAEADARWARWNSLTDSAPETNTGPRGLPLLHGMPTAFKDLTDVAGMPTTHGSAALEHRPAVVDSPLAAGLRAAGVISLGKTQVPEFGLTAYSENAVAAPSRNPYSLQRSSGGSSGGSAAAVAAGLLPFAPGSDGGGSVRIPAAACGLIGLKPGRGVLPGANPAGDPAQLVVNGPLAHTAADAALLLDALMSSPTAPDRRRQHFLASVDRAPQRLRIGVTLDNPWTSAYPIEVEPAAQDALGAGIALLEHAGHAVEETRITYDPRYPETFTTVWTADVGTARIAPHQEPSLMPLTRVFRRRAQQRSMEILEQSLAVLQQFERDTVAQYGKWDLILTPSLAQTPRPIGWFTGLGALGEIDPADLDHVADDDYRRQCQYAPWSSLINVCGLPAITVPVHWTGGAAGRGLPMGIQLVGRPGAEALLLQVAAHLGF